MGRDRGPPGRTAPAFSDRGGSELPFPRGDPRRGPGNSSPTRPGGCTGIHPPTERPGPNGASWCTTPCRPFARPLDSGGTGPRYGLYYEAYPPLALPLTAPAPPQALEVPDRPFDQRRPPAVDPRPDPGVSPPPGCGTGPLGFAVSNPRLVRDWTGACRLYFSASLAWIDDCGFCEPRYIALARASSPEGPFVPEPEPVIDPARDGMPGVLGAGAIKVLPLSDGYAGLQTKIYRDPRGRSRSALFVLRSEDGVSWTPARSEPLISPAEGWTASHVYSCDCRFRESDGRWYLYFNARDGWRISEGRERLGRIVGTPE
ncbi:MAG: hypothetical protein MZV70_69410 [Desulfobacterales bacterium]|nr:hypothetical protein [Desulfobacterales bacterium]